MYRTEDEFERDLLEFVDNFNGDPYPHNVYYWMTEHKGYSRLYVAKRMKEMEIFSLVYKNRD